MTESVKRTGSASTDITVKSCYEDLQKENASVLEEILALGNEVTKGDLQDLHRNLFFQMYNEVFPPLIPSSEMKLAERLSETGVNNPTVVDKCIRKLRQVHQRRFRGVFYLTGEGLEELNVTATAEVMKLFNKLAEKAFSTDSERDKSESALKERIALERGWLEKVNDSKRHKHFDQLKMEALESFKTTVELEFPYVRLDDENEVIEDENNNKEKKYTMQFYEEKRLKTQLEQLMKAVVGDFKQQLPSEEDPELVKALELSLRNELLDGSITSILKRNCGNRIRAQSAMYEQVEELVTNFKNKMQSFLQKSPLLNPPQIRSRHQEIVTEYLQLIEMKAVELAGPIEFHVHFQNVLNTKIDETFKVVMGEAFKEAQVSIEACSFRSENCVQSCAQNVEAIFNEFGASRYSSELRDKLEACLMEAIAAFRRNTILNVKKVEKLVESTKSKPIYTNAEKVEKLTMILESVKIRYRERVQELLKLCQNSTQKSSNVQLQDFQKTEENIRNDIGKLLRDEIRSKVGDDADLNRQLNKLNQYISDYWTKTLQKIVETLKNAMKHVPEPENQVNKNKNRSKNNKKVTKTPSKTKSPSTSKVVVDASKIQEVKKVIKKVMKSNNKPANNKVIQGQGKRPTASVQEVKKRKDSKDMRHSEPTFQKQHREMSELTVTWNRSPRESSPEKESPVVFQMAPTPKIPVGNVIIIKNPRNGDEYFLEPHLEINHERIASLKGVHLYYEMDGNCATNLPEKYRWNPANVEEEKRDQVVSFLDQVQSFQQLSCTGRSQKGKLSKTAKLTKAKKVLALMCNEMLDLLENNTAHIKTELGRDLIMKRIDEAVLSTEMTDSTLEEVKKQMEALGGIYSKYFHKRDMEKSPANSTPPSEPTDSEKSKDVDVIVAAGVSVNNNESEQTTTKLKPDMPLSDIKTTSRKKRRHCSCLRRLFKYQLKHDKTNNGN